MDDSTPTNEAIQSSEPASKGLSPAMQIRDRIIAVLKTVYDPEIPVDIYELGLVYGVEVTDDAEAHVTMNSPSSGTRSSAPASLPTSNTASSE